MCSTECHSSCSHLALGLVQMEEMCRIKLRRKGGGSTETGETTASLH